MVHTLLRIMFLIHLTDVKAPPVDATVPLSVFERQVSYSSLFIIEAQKRLSVKAQTATHTPTALRLLWVVIV